MKLKNLSASFLLTHLLSNTFVTPRPTQRILQANVTPATVVAPAPRMETSAGIINVTTIDPNVDQRIVFHTDNPPG